MKRLGQILGGFLAVALMAFSLQAVAETQLGGRDFNHMTTGFPLSGGHAVAACETCHTGGVFKGTPRNCDGCHATGKRIVATPKSTSHIVTDAPCESCHFNSATWLGARFNHGTAKKGECKTCHNSRIAEGAPNSGYHLTTLGRQSCDNCHRTSAWSPHSWNHNGVGTTCDTAGCHLSGANQWYKGVSTAHTRTGMATYSCQSCHNYFVWRPAPYNHAAAVGRCDGCHNDTVAVGPNHYGAHPAAISGNDCSQCHINNTRAWIPALGALPSNHIPLAGNECTACHISATSVKTGLALHGYLTSYSCATCHASTSTVLGGKKDDEHGGSYDGGSPNCSSAGCHRPDGTKGSSYRDWD